MALPIICYLKIESSIMLYQTIKNWRGIPLDFLEIRFDFRIFSKNIIQCRTDRLFAEYYTGHTI